MDIDVARVEQFRKSCADADYVLKNLYFLEQLCKAQTRDLVELRREIARRDAAAETEAAVRLERREQGIAIAGIVELIQRWRGEAKASARLAGLEPKAADAHSARMAALRTAANEAAAVLRKGRLFAPAQDVKHSNGPLSLGSPSASRSP